MAAKRNPPKEKGRDEQITAFLAEQTNKFTPVPTYWFEVGEKVSIGHLKDAVISSRLDDEGKYYEVDYTSNQRDMYNRTTEKPHTKGYYAWHNIRPFTKHQHPNLIQNEDLRLSFYQTTVESLISKKHSFGVDFNPAYQRDYVWDDADKQLLIDSVFRCIDIGKFAFIHLPYGTHPENKSYEILDGKQRLSALCDFYENRFSYQGIYYNDLTGREKSHFKNHSVTVADLADLTEIQKLRYFVTLNRAGKQMSEAHLQRISNRLESLESGKG